MGNNVSDQVKKAFDTVRSGGVILYPTDTIWGLGCDATNREAIEKLNSIKKRNSKSPMLSLVRDASMISHYIEEMPKNLNQLISQLNEPSTILYKTPKNICNLLISDIKLTFFLSILDPTRTQKKLIFLDLIIDNALSKFK